MKLVISILLVIWVNPIFAQMNWLAQDSTLWGQQMIPSFIHELGVDMKIVYEDVEQLLGIEQSLDSGTTWISENSNRILIDNYFFVGDSFPANLYPAHLFTNIGLNSQINVATIPLSLNTNIVLEEGNYKKRLSSISIGLNQERLLAELQAKYIPSRNISDYLSAPDNPLQLTQNEKKHLQQEVKYRICQQIITHPKYIAYRDSLLQQLEEWEQDTILSVTPNHLERQLDSLRWIEQQYDQLWSYKTQTKGITLQSIQSKAQAYLKTQANLKDSNALKAHLLKQPLALEERIQLLTKTFQLGWSSLNESDFTTRHLALNGIQYAYEDSLIQAGIAFGRQQIPTQLLAFNFNPINNKRNVLFAKVGIGQADQEQVEVSFLQVKDSTLNQVVQLKGSKSINERQRILLETALSQYSAINEEKRSAANSAIGIKWQLEAIKLPLQLALGYFRIGADYVSLGNPFLLTNKQGVSLDIQSQLLDNKLTLKASGRIGKTIDNSRQAAVQDGQLLGEATYRFGKQNLISARILPNIFYQGSYENRLQAQQTIYTVQGNIVHEMKNSQLLSIAQISNIRTGFEWIDSLEIEQTAFLYLQENWVQATGNSLNAALQIGKTDRLYQLDYQWAIGQGSLQVGGQWTKQYGIRQYGMIGGIQIPIGQQIGFQLNATYRMGDQTDFFGNCSTQLQF